MPDSLEGYNSRVRSQAASQRTRLAGLMAPFYFQNRGASMKTIVTLKELKAAFGRLAGVVDAKSTLPVYGYVKLTAAKNTAHLIGSSLSSSIQTQLPVVGSEDGVMLLPYEAVNRLLPNVPEDSTITIQETEGKGLLIAGEFKLKFTTTGLSDFPELEQAPATQGNYALATLSTLLDRTGIAAPAVHGRFSIPVVLLESTASTLLAAALDGHRIAVATADATAGARRILLPRDAIGLVKGLKNGEENQAVAFAETENNLFFGTSDTLLLVRKSTAVFPAYQKPFEQTFVLAFEIPVQAFRTAIKRAQAILDEKLPGVLFEYRGGDDLFVSYKNGETLRDTADVIKTKGTSLNGSAASTPVFKLNANFLSDYLEQAAENGNVTLQYAGDSKPVLLKNDDYKYVVMPIAG